MSGPRSLFADVIPRETLFESEECTVRSELLQGKVELVCRQIDFDKRPVHKDMAPEHSERIRIPEKRQYSFHAFEALEFAYDRGLDFAFTMALYDLMWTEGRDIGDPETLLAAAEKVGLDPRELALALYERTYAERTLAAVKQAHEIGITNTPTIGGIAFA